MQTPVDTHFMTIESFNRQFQIGEKEREAVNRCSGQVSPHFGYLEISK